MRLLSNTVWEQIWEARHKRDQAHGLKWTDMPGTDADAKKINYFLFKRGLLDDCGTMQGPALKARQAVLRRAGRKSFSLTRRYSTPTTTLSIP